MKSNSVPTQLCQFNKIVTFTFQSVDNERVLVLSQPFVASFHIHIDFNDFSGLDPDISPDEQEEKARLIAQVLELQNTLDGWYLQMND